MTRLSIALGASGAHPFRSALRRAPAVEAPARHPLRAALAARHEGPKEARAQALWRRLQPRQQDLRDFLLAYCACFIAAIAFIS